MDNAKRSINVENVEEEVGTEIWCVCSGALKNRRGQGEGVKCGYSTWGLITSAGLARSAEILAP